MNNDVMAKADPPVIMIVDDTPRNIQIVGNILRNEVDCDFSFATNGKEALGRIQKRPPDLILLDVMMPEMDGFETCAKLKESEDTRMIPVIFLTAKTETENVVRGFNLGAVDYVAKPFNPPELLARVRTQLSIKEKNDALAAVVGEQMELLHVLCHDLANPFGAIVSALDLVQDAETFLAFKPELMSSATSGLEVIDLVRKMRKLQESRDALALNEAPLEELVRESTVMLRGKFEEKNVQLKVDLQEGLVVRIEPTSFVNSVLNNLLTNALKFSFPDSTVEVDASRGDGRVSLIVRDHGVGMPERLLGNLFDVGKATSRPGTNDEPGTGFGMPLVKKFVNVYDGEISVESKEQSSEGARDGGTTVTISLPSLLS